MSSTSGTACTGRGRNRLTLHRPPSAETPRYPANSAFCSCSPYCFRKTRAIIRQPSLGFNGQPFGSSSLATTV